MPMPKMSRRRHAQLILLSIASMLVPAAPAEGYKVWPLKSVHEAMSLLAQQCLEDAEGTEPRDCRNYYTHLATLSRHRPSGTYDDLQIAVRWPDDPARQVTSPGILNFGANMGIGCEGRIRRRWEQNREVPRLDEVGILCSSHFGRLQFLHAQAVVGEQDGQTRERILDWADLTFRIATGRVRPTERICSYMESNRSAIADSFALDPSRCESWTFATFFGWRCANPASMGRCPPLMPHAGANALAVRTARGALLHLIQDSYSQSHVARGAGPARPNRYDHRVDCSLPTRFYSFYGQKGHGAADQVPRVDENWNCRRDDREADDAITASAMALYHMERRSDPAVFSCYLQRRVFGLRPGAACPLDA